MRLLIIVLLSGIWIGAKGQISLKALPDSLIQNANEVVVYDRTTFEIFDLENSELTREYEAIILNGKGKDLSTVILHYNAFRKISDAEIHLYNLYGKEVEHIRLKDFEDYSTKGYSLADDRRAKYYEVVAPGYPYRIKVSYRILYAGYMFYPAWYAQSDEHQGVIESSLQLICPDEQYFRHRSVGVSPQMTRNPSGKTVFTWKAGPLKPFEREAFSQSVANYTPEVHTAPNQFVMDGFQGDLSSWAHFGHWINQLNETQNTLTEHDRQEFLQNIPAGGSTLEKIKATYEYLQNNTRYVSIQLGIGSWQPFSSGFVHEHKYGDCKALSFYAKCLLETLGIPAYYTLINAGKHAYNTDPNFPEAYFNHVILTVPTEKDTVWLECTSQTNPFGYLGTFTGNRNALMITEDGARIIQTKRYSAKENLQQTTATLLISETGAATAEISRIFSGMQIENDQVHQASLKAPEDQLKWFYDRHRWGSMTVSHLSIDKPSQETTPLLKMSLSARFDKLASFSSNRLFYEPFLFTNLSGIKLPDTHRQQPIEIRDPYLQKDTIEAVFPEGFYPENTPKEIHLTTEFGEYHVELFQKGNHFLFVRTFILFAGIHAPAQYESFRNFIRNVQKYDKSKLVMLNKT